MRTLTGASNLGAHVVSCDGRELLLKSERRDAQLWTIVLATLLILTAGFAALLAPYAEGGRDSRLVTQLPQLVVGLVVLIVLLTLYVLDQRRLLGKTRTALLEQIARAEQATADSFTDPLTKVFNRRYMEIALAREVKRADRTGAPFSVLMIDVNNLGLVNNRHGHQEGDRLLFRLAQVLREAFRQSDTVVRYGGDEFLLILPDTGEPGATACVNRLRRRLDAVNRAENDRGVPIGLSCGISSYEKGRNIEEVIQQADHRMYQEKSRRVRDIKPATSSQEDVQTHPVLAQPH